MLGVFAQLALARLVFTKQNLRQFYRVISKQATLVNIEKLVTIFSPS